MVQSKNSFPRLKYESVLFSGIRGIWVLYNKDLLAKKKKNSEKTDYLKNKGSWGAGSRSRDPSYTSISIFSIIKPTRAVSCSCLSETRQRSKKTFSPRPDLLCTRVLFRIFKFAMIVCWKKGKNWSFPASGVKEFSWLELPNFNPPWEEVQVVIDLLFLKGFWEIDWLVKLQNA